MHFTIFANGDVAQKIEPISKDSRIIAADGGARHCQNLGITPEAVIGDFDSIHPKLLDRLKRDGVEIIRHPVDKNETDLELAIEYAVKIGAKKITLFGILGGRWDMSFANIFLLAAPRYSSVDFHVIGDHLEIFLLRGGKSITLTGKSGDPVSVLPLCERATGINYNGLGWALHQAKLAFGSPLGVSNHMLSEKANISLESGILLIFHEFQVGKSNDAQSLQRGRDG